MAKIPEQIDKYKIEALVATGGMGAVFKGIHPTLKRPVILKKLTLRGNASVTERFRREARILMDFRNDYIVDVQDHFIQGRSHYIVMEYVDGLSVKDLIDEERYLDNCSAAYIALYIARALAYAHAKGVVHRDIKPGNILIAKTGEVKLADFGIASAKDLDSGEDEELTTDGMTLGTPAYMAPEQFQNSRTVDFRADLYSLGVMLYEMLTGLKPFPGGFNPETIRLIQKGRYKQPGRVNPTVAPELQKIIALLIRPRPGKRVDVETVIRRLEAYLEKFRAEDVKARICALVQGESLPAVQPRTFSRLKLYILGGAVLLTVAFVLTGYGRLTGFHRLLASPEEYGVFRLSVDSEAQPETEIFLDDGAEIPSVRERVLYFPGSSDYRSMRLVLPAESYRVKTRVGSEVIWTSFTLKARSETGETRLVRIRSAEAQPRRLEILMDVHDAETGWDLEGEAVLEVFLDGKYMALEKAGEIFSGKVLLFRISAPGYESQEYGLRIGSSESILHFQADLKAE